MERWGASKAPKSHFYVAVDNNIPGFVVPQIGLGI